MNDTTFIPRHDVEVPPRMRHLPRDERGYIVPRFVSWLKDGKLATPTTPGAHPDFRAIDTKFLIHAVGFDKCWLCGEKLGSKHVFAIGPMCSVNRITSEPGSHLDCAHYAVKVCPFMLEPRMKRNDAKPIDAAVVVDPAGLHHDRNPGVMLLWTSGPAEPVRVEQGRWGQLLKLGPPRAVEWWTRGRLATPEEAREGLASGVEQLAKIARDKDGPEGERELARLVTVAEKLLPGVSP